MDNILRAINKAETLEIVKDIINHVNDNQIACKDWLFEHLPKHKRAMVLGGWYGLTASKLPGSQSIDIDPNCKKYGKIIYPDVDFITECAFTYMARKPQYDMIINTSCEHMPQPELDFLVANKRWNSMIAFQSNNYFDGRDHINCKKSLDEFVSEYPLREIIYKGELDRGKYQRWMVIGI